MRSLAINYTFDPKVMDATYQNQYEFGNGFMVAPFESTAAFGKVYFPEGNWYDLYTGQEQKGKQEVTIPVTVSKLPVYVKGGSIIPMQSLTQSTAELPTDTLAVHVYKGSKANHFVYYEDDGKSFGYQKGDFYKRDISFDPAKKTITFDKAEGSYKTNFKYIRLVLHGFEQSTFVKAGNVNLKLQDSAVAFLGAAANTDPQGNVNAPESSPVKTVTINNTSNNIQINY